jgi:aryl-alcohol dehydrogenase-like predicted oxidoreductase
VAVSPPDPKVPFADSVGVLAEAKAAGKVRYVGLSNVNGEQIETALSIVDVVSVQNQFSLAHRTPEMTAACKNARIGSAFCPGVRSAAWAAQRHRKNGRAFAVGERTGRQPAARRSGLAPVAKYDRLIPIPGASRPQSVEDNAQSGELYDGGHSRRGCGFC